MPWEGILAKRAGINLNAFRLDDYNVPYGYSPILLAHPDVLDNKQEAISKFLKASAKGFLFAQTNPEEAVKILAGAGNQKELKNEAFLLESQKSINPFYSNEKGEWGKMEDERWNAFSNWLKSQKLLEEETFLNHNSLYTNKYL
jgi:NitT/TauT family transport system substrate-binding protein